MKERNNHFELSKVLLSKAKQLYVRDMIVESLLSSQKSIMKFPSSCLRHKSSAKTDVETWNQTG